MRTALLAFIVLFPAVCSAQGTPGGVYRAPGQLEDWSYEPQHKARFTVQVIAPVTRVDKQGREYETEQVIGRYSITDSQWPGMKKNVQKFCRQRKMVVFEIDGSDPVRISLVPAPEPDEPEETEPKKELPPTDPNYAKGLSPAPAKKK